MKKTATLLLLALIALSPALASSDNWPTFRGTDALNSSEDDPRLPESWSQTHNVLWKLDIPGLGWSSPVVWGNRVFITTVVSEGEIEEPKKGLYYGGNRLQPSKEAQTKGTFLLS